MKSHIKKQIKKVTNQITNELILVFISLLAMWGIYYLDQHNCSFVWFSIATFVMMIGACVVFPAYWIAIRDEEGMAGLMITTKKLLLSLGVGALLGTWRGLELIPFLQQDNLLYTVLFNGLCIWEVFFIYCWMYTRYRKAFGTIPACILTALSVGLYHVGSLPVFNILYLIFCIFICAIAVSFTNNVLTLWPLYWFVGCSASTLKGGMIFSIEMVVLAAAALIIQLICLVIIGLICRKRKKQREELF